MFVMMFATRNLAGIFMFAVILSFTGFTGRKNPMQRARMQDTTMLMARDGTEKCPEANTPWVERIMLTVIPMAMFIKKLTFLIVWA